MMPEVFFVWTALAWCGIVVAGWLLFGDTISLCDSGSESTALGVEPKHDRHPSAIRKRVGRTKKANDEDKAQQKYDEEAAEEKTVDEAKVKQKTEEETATKKKADDEAKLKRTAVKTASAKKKADDEAKAKQKTDEEAVA